MSVSLVPKRRPWLAISSIVAVALAMLTLPRQPPATDAPDDDPGGRAILLGLAQTAEREHRLLAPAGSNATSST